MSSADFGSEKISKLLWKQSFPASIGILVISIYSLVDTLFIGQYVGGVGIAAITFVAPFIFLIAGISMAIGIGGATLISINLGKKDIITAKQVVANQMILLIVASLLVVSIGLVFESKILTLLGAAGESMAAAKAYYCYTVLGMPFFMGQMVFNNVLRAEGKARQAMYILAVPSVLNIFLDAWFIIKMDMGLEGAALATMLSMGISIIIGIYYLLKSEHILPSRGDLQFKLSLTKLILKLGSVQFLNQVTVSLAVVVINNLLIKYGGDLAVSSYGLAIRLIMFAVFPIVGIIHGYMPIAGFNYGAEKYDRFKKTVNLSFVSTTVIGLVISAGILIWTENIVSLFTQEQDLIEMSSIVIFWVFCTFPLVGVQRISTTYFQVVGRANPALILTIAKQIFLVICVFSLPIWFGLNGVWYSFALTEFSLTGITYIVFRNDLKNRITTG